MIIDILSKATVSLMRANTRAELQEALQSTVTSLGFDSFNLSCGKSDKREFMMDPTVSSWDEDDLRRYEQDRWAERDPLLHYAAGVGPVRSWKITDWLNTRDEEYVRYLMEVGLKGGVTPPLTTNPGSLAAMTVLSADKDAFDDQIVARASLAGEHCTYADRRLGHRQMRCCIATVGLENALGSPNGDFTLGCTRKIERRYCRDNWTEKENRRLPYEGNYKETGCFFKTPGCRDLFLLNGVGFISNRKE